MGLYKAVKPEDGVNLQYVGIYVLKWNFDWGQPEIGFVESDYTFSDALDNLEDVQFTDNTIDQAIRAKEEVREILRKLAGIE